MIPLKETIDEDKWILFTDNKKFHFKLKLLSFEKVNMAKVDISEDFDEEEIIDEGGAYWLLKVEVISLCKAKIRTSQVTEDIGLVDQDGFRFDVTWNMNMACYSKFAKKSGLARLYGQELSPKIKAVGAVTFFLPDEEGAIYSVTNINGKIKLADGMTNSAEIEVGNEQS